MYGRKTDRGDVDQPPRGEATNASRGASFRAKLIGLLIAVAILATLYWRFREQLSLEALSAHEGAVRDFWTRHPALTYLAAIVLYTIVTGLSLPGAAAMTLIYGWFFGVVRGIIVVSFASTSGATLAFLLSRYLFRDAIQHRFGERLARFNDALRREGPFYLFTLRLIPAVPFFAINVVMGLTPLGVGTFWWVSQLGMLPGTCVYCYAGSTVPELRQIVDPSRLRVADVRDWSALESAVDESARDAAQTPADRVRDHLEDTGLQELLKDAAGGPNSAAARSDVIAELNRLLSDPGFYDSDVWRNVELDAETQAMVTEHQSAPSLEGKNLTRLNRRLLEAAFRGIISSPRPILSPQLFLAFVLLGVFPLLARRIMARFRPEAIAPDI